MVFSLTNQGGERVKDVESVLDRETALSPEMLVLARWMKDRYYCTLFEAVKLMIPTGIHLRLREGLPSQPGGCLGGQGILYR